MLLLFSSISVFFNKRWVIKLVISITIGLYIFIIELFAYYINSIMDSGKPIKINTSDDENGIHKNEFHLPIGIPKEFWDERQVLFNNLDEEVMILIRDGFRADDVFAIAALINNGDITRKTKLAKEYKYIPEKHTEVTVCNRQFIVSLTS